jgi:uncharacterized protein YlaI
MEHVELSIHPTRFNEDVYWCPECNRIVDVETEEVIDAGRKR